jgi:hypothetical protein
MPGLVPKLGSNILARLGSPLAKRCGFCGTSARLRAVSGMLFTCRRMRCNPFVNRTYFYVVALIADKDIR